MHLNIYGTSKAAVEKVLNEGKICLLDIDVQGARSVRAASLKGKFIFVKPPSLEVFSFVPVLLLSCRFVSACTNFEVT